MRLFCTRSNQRSNLLQIGDDFSKLIARRESLLTIAIEPFCKSTDCHSKFSIVVRAS